MGAAPVKPCVSLCVVTMERASQQLERTIAEQLASAFCAEAHPDTGLAELNRVEPSSSRLAAWDEGVYDLGTARGFITFVNMPDTLRGISALRTLPQLWGSCKGIVLVASEAELREFDSAFSNLFLRNLSMINAAGTEDAPRLILQVSDRHELEPAAEVVASCKAMTGPWSERAPLAVRCIATNSTTARESLKAGIQWLVDATGTTSKSSTRAAS